MSGQYNFCLGWGQYNSCLLIRKIIWLYFYIHEDYFYILIIDITTVCRKQHHWKRSWMNLVLFWPRWLQKLPSIFIFLCSSFPIFVSFILAFSRDVVFFGGTKSLVSLISWRNERYFAIITCLCCKSGWVGCGQNGSV